MTPDNDPKEPSLSLTGVTRLVIVDQGVVAAIENPTKADVDQMISKHDLPEGWIYELINSRNPGVTMVMFNIPLLKTTAPEELERK
jgi:hypothetical protein